jgi:hypothetical protein
LLQLKRATAAHAGHSFSFSRMIYVKASGGSRAQISSMWQPIASAPFDCDLELAVLDSDGPHALVFACRRILGGWMKMETRERLDVHPTHWRRWDAHVHAA